MKYRLIFSLALLAFSAVLFPLPGQAELYAYVDSQGVCHYTNVPGDNRYKLIDNLSDTMRAHRAVIRTRPLQEKKYKNVRPRVKRRSSYGNLDLHIHQIAKRHQIDPHLVKAVIKTESNFNPWAVSSHGAQGLMQLMPATARDLSVKDPFDPIQNIDGGTRYLRRMLNSYRGDISKSLAAYNAGPGRVSQYGNLPAIPETREYVRRVLAYYNQYRGKVAVLSSIKVGKLRTIY